MDEQMLSELFEEYYDEYDDDNLIVVQE